MVVLYKYHAAKSIEYFFSLGKTEIVLISHDDEKQLGESSGEAL